jgi:PAS domain S-box-containing protein
MLGPLPRLTRRPDHGVLPSLWVRRMLRRVRNPNARPQHWLKFGIVAFLAILIAALWAELVYESRATEEAALAQARKDASNLTIAFSENVRRTLGGIDQLLLMIIAELPNNPDDYRIPTWVRSSPLPDGIESHVTLIGPDGMVRASTLDYPGPVDVSDRPHFRHHLDPTASQPYISVPVVGRISGKWSVQVTRRITRKDGTFGGVITFALDPFYFSHFFDSVDLGKDGVMVLAGLDGIVRSRRAMANQEIGQDISDTTLFQRLREASSGTDITRAKVDGKRRIYGYHLVPDYPLVVSVGLSLDDILAGPLRERTIRFAVGSLLTVIVLALSWLLVHEINRRRSRVDRLIVQQKLQLDAALNNMSQGLCMFDRNWRLVLCNQRYSTMYGLSADMVTPGLTLRELLERRKQVGTFSEDPERYATEVLARIKQGGMTSRSFVLQDGRTIHVENIALADGGFVSTHNEITQERRAAEALSAALAKAGQVEREARAAHARLRDAFEVIPEGIALFDAQDRYVLWNRRYAELYGETAGDFKAGMRFEDALRAGLARGQYHEAIGREEEWLSERLARHSVQESIHEQRLLGDRWIRVQERRTADGGSIGVRIDITDLKQREASFRLLFEGHPLPMYVFDLDSLRFLAVNDAAVAHYGYTREQFLNLTILDIRPIEDRESFLARLRGVDDFEAGEILRHQKADGTMFEAAVYSRMLIYEGRIARLASSIDITERRRAERERDRNREFLDLIIDSVPITILVKDANDRKYVLLNQAGEKLWGKQRGQVVGKTAYELFPKARADLIDEHDEQALGSDVPFVLGEHKSFVRDDDERIVTSKTFAIRGKEGEPQYLVSVVEDVTEHRRMEIERDRNREFLDLVIENVPATILVKEARNQRYLLVNRSCENLWGVPRAEIIGKTAHELFPRETADSIAERDLGLLESDASTDVIERTIKMPNNTERLVVTRRFLIRDKIGAPQYLVGVIEDITERRAFEQQLHQAQKMEAVGSLTGGLAHDFNNLLTIIIGNLDLLQDDLAGNITARQKVDTILQASLRGADLTGQLLAFSRRQPLQPKRIDINELIANTTRLLTRTLAGDIQVDVRCSPELWPVIVDETQLQTALVNIAINARDAMPNGGKLTLATYNADIDADEAAKHPELSPGGYAVIEVADTGTGMPRDVLDRIFEPFFTTKDPGKGTGLGLSMVYGLVKQSGGHIRAESEEGFGATFKLYLPRASSAQLSPAVPAEDGGARQTPGRARGEVILAVDDNPDVRRAAVIQLQVLGYEVMEADGAAAALKVLESEQKIDLLFTDVVMPGGINGKELANKARAMRPQIKVLFTSGFPGKLAGSATELGAEDILLSKPYRRDDLARAVEQVLR